jgi:hypothetical protein
MIKVGFVAVILLAGLVFSTGNIFSSGNPAPASSETVIASESSSNGDTLIQRTDVQEVRGNRSGNTTTKR